MQSSPHLLRVLLQTVRDAVVTTDSSAQILMLNRAAEAMTGWLAAEAVGRPVGEVVDLRKNDGSQFEVDPVRAVLRENKHFNSTENLLLMGKNGVNTSVQITASPVYDSVGQVEGCVLALHDVSEALQLAKRIAYLSNYDHLTGLPNRILLMDRMEQATRLADRNNDRLAVIFVDLDRFGAIRTSCTNSVADEMLKEMAARINAALRESDTVCRLGGDEFVIMVTGVKSISDIEAVAAKLLVEIAKRHKIGNQILQTTCSIGISIYPRDASDGETLMRLADRALRQAKQDGRNCFRFAKSDIE
jgi:diguanylate cyclase (GGDEF)-like protein/PAS domain S-box-containing protein